MAKSKRAGRKATGRKRSEVFSTRLTPELRGRIQSIANENTGGNIARAVEGLLTDAISLLDERDAGMEDLLYLARQVVWHLGPDWLSTPNQFAMFKSAMAVILESLSPPSKNPDVPPAVLEMWPKVTDQLKAMSSEQLGKMIGRQIIAVLTLSPPLPRDLTAPRGSPFYRLAQIRSRLGIAQGQSPHLEETMASWFEQARAGRDEYLAPIPSGKKDADK